MDNLARYRFDLCLTISGGDKRSWLSRPDTAIQAAILSGVN